MKFIVRGVLVLIVAAGIAWCAQRAIDTGKLGDLHFAEGRGLGLRIGGDGGDAGRRHRDGGAGEIFGTLITMTVISGVVVVGSKIRQARRRRR